jgi:hypothetical protein
VAGRKGSRVGIRNADLTFPGNSEEFLIGRSAGLNGGVFPCWWKQSPLADAMLASQRAVTLANERYERGLTDFLNDPLK